MTRVWWCPTGPLTALPLHAAGRYSHTTPTATQDTLLRRVICSYVPTLASLRNPSHSSRPRNATTQLAIGMPHTRGLSSLPAVIKEMTVLASYFSPPSSGKHLLPPHATRSAVPDALPHYPWVHFACHAYQDQASPSQNAFALCDGSVTVADLAALPTSHSELAFLSACETGAASLRLMDESIHLAAAMQLVGYQHVIATLWTIGDTSAPDVAENFYNWLFRDGEPTSAKTAEALHHAVTKLYETHSANPLVWAAYIQVGP
jgi:CHAT domain-containing protein